MNIKFDGPLDIAVGRSRTEKRWQNKEMLWSSLLNRISQTHRTAESYEEYIKLKKERQDNIKDIGGFIGGLLGTTRRKNGSIIHRQLITLDLDFVPSADMLWDIIELNDYAAAVYSTHKHCIEKPRLRLIIPLSRPVNSEEYEAIARKIAAKYDIEWFDPTTYQPARLMYWPSTSKDGNYFFNYQDAQWLDADAVLNEYINWQDAAEWPVSSAAKDKVKSLIKQQANPLTKAGMVGAFSRAYTIQEAIRTFLSDIYEPTESDERFTFKSGSTANGLVVYDDKFAFSHHATDPISGKLCNSFDLVRLHKFGHLDEKHTDETGTKLPSYVAMTQFASDDEIVRVLVGEEKLKEARELFPDDPHTEANKKETEDPDEWMKKMELDKQANYMPTINNIVLILENDPGLKNVFTYNDFDHRETLGRDAPWRKRTPLTINMVDADESNLRHYMELIYGINSKQKTEDALTVVQRRHKYHPVKDWLNSLEWDGAKRAETLFIDYLGAENTNYVKQVTRKTLTACIARIMEPGCKFDNIPVIIGPQGIGKSTLIRRLGHKWFSDSLADLRNKDALEQLQGVWILELGELASLKKAEVELIKHFTAKQDDRFRVAYGRRAETFPRQCVFMGTTNNFGFLKDHTGNRRFWPIQTNINKATDDLFTAFTKQEVEQVWAEVMLWYMMSEQLHLDLKTEAEAYDKQLLHMEEDDRAGALQHYLDMFVPYNWDSLTTYERRAWMQADKEEIAEKGITIRNQISAAEVWCELLGGTIKELTTYNTKDVHNLVRRLKDWEFTESYRRVPMYGRQRVYLRIDSEEWLKWKRDQLKP